VSGSICPTCRSELDPARAPVARIRDGHVLTFCSTACAEGQAVAIVRREQTPVRAEETATSKAWYDKADEVVAKASAEAAADVDDLWDADPPEPAAPAKLATRGYTWDDSRAPPDKSEVDAPAGKHATLEPAASRPRGRRLGKRHVLMIAGAILVGGMVIAIIETVSPSTPSPVSAETDARGAATAPVELAPEADPAPEDTAPEDMSIDPAKLAAAAVAELRSQMNSESPRIVRDAALALARQGDAEAIEVLTQGLATDPSPHARVKIAYVLARGGDTRAVGVLEDALSDQRRDLRMDAARALARLGNDSGRKALRAMLKVRTHRIGAAGVLALLGDDEGLSLLRETIADEPSVEVKNRAAVYLGAAGQQEVRELLRGILDDGDRVGAANALAVLGDETAAPALLEQLGMASLRVDAAVSLRRLGAELDLEPLAMALISSDKIGRVSAAEAILILTDPKQPVEIR
jgi:HEAT repeat protein